MSHSLFAALSFVGLAQAIGGPARASDCAAGEAATSAHEPVGLAHECFRATHEADDVDWQINLCNGLSARPARVSGGRTHGPAHLADVSAAAPRGHNREIDNLLAPALGTPIVIGPTRISPFVGGFISPWFYYPFVPDAAFGSYDSYDLNGAVIDGNEFTPLDPFDGGSSGDCKSIQISRRCSLTTTTRAPSTSSTESFII